MTGIRTFRREVEAGPLPSSVKVTLLAHSDAVGPGHFHDSSANIHSFKYEYLAERTGKKTRTISRHMKHAVRAGYLKKHSPGYRTHQQEFHYTLPWEPWNCEDCDASTLGDTDRLERVTSLAPNPADECTTLVVSPSSSREPSVTFLPQVDPPGAVCRPRGSEEGDGEQSAEGGLASVVRRCAACDQPLHPALTSREPEYDTHPSCDAAPTGVLASVRLAA